MSQIRAILHLVPSPHDQNLDKNITKKKRKTEQFKLWPLRFYIAKVNSCTIPSPTKSKYTMQILNTTEQKNKQATRADNLNFSKLVKLATNHALLNIVLNHSQYLTRLTKLEIPNIGMDCIHGKHLCKLWLVGTSKSSWQHFPSTLQRSLR